MPILGIPPPLPGPLTRSPPTLASAIPSASVRIRGTGYGYWREPKKVKAAYLGVSASRLTPAMRSQLSLPAGVGLAVETVDKDSPGAVAGLKQYDVLHKLNDQILVNLDQLSTLVRTFKPGDEVTLTVIRQAKPTVLKAKLVEKEVDDLVDVDSVLTLGAAGTPHAGAGGGTVWANPGLPVLVGRSTPYRAHWDSALVILMAIPPSPRAISPSMTAST